MQFKAVSPLALRAAVAGLLSLGLFSVSYAQVSVKEPWVRATVAQQQATGAFLQITSATPARLVSASSPVAAVVEIHEMSMDAGVMKMRAVPALELPAGVSVELKPGGYHVMLMGLKNQIKAGDSVPLSLVVEGTNKKRETIELMVPARALGGAPASAH